ncbi:MAG: AMP-binding protein, partial [Deltaproteobacteria bacterium]|nr:AMP-binding protein [Deltaproteobacteria bacterium]
MNLHRRLFGLLDAARTNYLWRPSSTRGVVWALESWARERPDDPFLSFEERSFSIGAFNAAANRYAATYRRHHDLKRDDVVALILRNRPAYLWHVYGLFKLGAIPALINPELRDTSLIHALAESAPRFIVCEGDLVATLTKAIAAIAAPIPHLEGILVDTESDRDAPKDAEKTDSERPEAAAITRGDRPTSARIPIPRTRPFKVDETRDNARDDARDDARSRDIPLAATAAYVFTSGTTGLPKAAIVKHHRLYRAGRIFGDILAAGRDDGLYICLPLFHANAQVIGVPLAILHRTRLILARRFSAQRFFADCAAHHATLAIYIGEICRYLLNTPPGPQDRTHGIRAILGNGLAPNLWRPLRTRFGIQQIAEFYAATEGNAETVNILGIPGSCGSLIVGKRALVP